MTSVFIGMPVHNGAPFISEAIDSIRNQNYTDWILLISDNASEDTTQEICENYAKIDSRIKYLRKKENFGAKDNFEFLLKSSDAEYFMWAAADDLWDKNFISMCISLLQKNNTIGMAFCNIVNIDSFGRIIREYPPFKDFSGPSNIKTIFNYLMSPESLGKANLIYSIYRTKICKAAWDQSLSIPVWGSDMCFVLGALARGGITIEDQVLFYKRIPSSSDTITSVNKITNIDTKKWIFPFIGSFNYLKCNLNAVKGTKYYWFTLIILLIRIPRSFYNWTIEQYRYYKYGTCVQISKWIKK